MKIFRLLLPIAVALLSWQCTEKKQGFQPPIPSLDIPYATYEFIAEEGTLIDHPGGTQIIVPPDALTDEDGNPVKGKVALKYRELHGALDAFVAGASLDYDSAGVKYHFQTAGMMDISAKQGEEQLTIASGKEIDINFASHQSGDDYNFYEWDEKEGRWVFKREARPAKRNTAKKRMRDSLQAVRVIDPKNLMVLHFGEALDVYFNYHYQKVNDKNMQANFRRLLATYGLAVYEQLKINAPVRLGKSYYPAYTLVWEKMGAVQPPAWLNGTQGYVRENEKTDTYFYLEPVVKPQKDGSYVLTIQRRKTKQVKKDITFNDTTWQVNRRTGKRRVGNITQRTEQRWQTVYQNKVVNSFSFRARPYMRISEFLRRKPEQLTNEYERLVQEMNITSRKIDEIAEVFRSVSISRFSYYNFDKIMKLPGATQIAADFRMDGAQPEKIYYISPAYATKIELARDAWESIYIAPDQTLRIFAVMPDYSIAYFPVEEWKNLDWYRLLQTKNYTFTLKNNNDPIKTREDLKKVLQM